MSECVVRMEMPLNCLECPMYDWNRQKLCCNAHFDLRPIPNGGVPKPDWCPILCALPEGHGTLIDLETTAEGLSERFNSCHMTCGAVMQFLDGLPTIVPAERRANNGTDKA